MPKYIYKHRRGTVSQWADHSTTVPHEGEIVIEIDDVNGLHKLKIGDGVHTYAELAYLKAGDEIVSQVLAEVKPRIVTVELTTNWSQASDGKYSQVIALDNITNHSRLDLQPTADMLAEFKQLGLVFVTENNGGTITVYSVGNMPLKAYTMQATIIETECDGDGMPVVGIPVGAPAAQADWNQTATNSPEFIKNKPTLGALASKDEVAKTDLAATVQASLNKADTAIQSIDGLATEDYVDQAITDHTLIGSTTELTPTAVVEAVATGRNVILAHTDATFGLLAANHFTFSPDDQTVLATSVVPYGGGYVAYALIGFLSSNTWNSMYTIVAEQEKVDAAIAELSEGFENVIFQMYGSDFDTENETAPTIRQIANDEATTALNAAKEYTGTYVDEKVAGLVDSSPETLNTLNELAAALGDDPNFATTVATEIGQKADKAQIPTKTSQLTNDSNFVTSDGTVAKATTADQLGGVAASSYAKKTDIPSVPVTSVAGKTGVVTLAKGDVGLGSVVNTGDSATPVSGGTTKFTTGGAYTELGKKMDKVDPTAIGSFSMGRKTGSTVGSSSFAAGLSVEASGSSSHAEGESTTASGNRSHAEGSRTIASGSFSHAEGYSTTASGSSSHAEGYSTTASGDRSHAEGESTTASGNRSHAEGSSTIASGSSSHAEGSNSNYSITISGDANATTYTVSNTSIKVGHLVTYNEITAKVTSVDKINKTITLDKTLSTTAISSVSASYKAGGASGSSSHAEGYSTTASGDFGSHAEGSYTTASGDYSHAEGESTTASGDSSHAEGSRTTASGDYSHAEGNSTTAINRSQHVQGEYNILDTTGGITSRGKYAHIVGNGIADTVRSNAHTIDWSGNGWFAGQLKVGGTSYHDANAKKVATLNDIPGVVTTSVAGLMSAADKNKLDSIPAASTSNNGAFLRVVNGAWAAVQLPNVEEGEF